MRHGHRRFAGVALRDMAQRRRDVVGAAIVLGGLNANGVGQDLHDTQRIMIEPRQPARP